MSQKQDSVRQKKYASKKKILQDTTFHQRNKYLSEYLSEKYILVIFVTEKIDSVTEASQYELNKSRHSAIFN